MDMPAEVAEQLLDAGPKCSSFRFPFLSFDSSGTPSTAGSEFGSGERSGRAGLGMGLASVEHGYRNLEAELAAVFFFS